LTLVRRASGDASDQGFEHLLERGSRFVVEMSPDVAEHGGVTDVVRGS